MKNQKPKSKIGMALALIIILLVVFYPNIEMSILTASNPQYAPSDAWVNSLLWMKDNTPEPMRDPDAYYQLYEWPWDGVYDYPESAYGVMAWWDYGYWISRIAHRIPNATGGQATEPTTLVARFFTSRDEGSANKIAEELGSAYVIIDYEMATNKLRGLALWAGEDYIDYFDVYYEPQGKRLIPVRLYYPDYYRLFSTRLYNFNGKAVTPGSVVVVSYEELGERNHIISKKQFDTYEEAEVYLLSRESGNYRIVGTNPFISPVPLEALKHYRLIHSSNETIEYSEIGTVPEVKIFEYLPQEQVLNPLR